MKVKVTQEDIEAGRTKLNARCGCPIWHALVRDLQLPYGGDLFFEFFNEVRLGRIKILLPKKAQKWQEDGLRNPESLYPFVFNARISY